MLSNYDMSAFKPEFEKDYEMFGAKFTIQVQNLGYNDLGPAWLFALIVKGNMIQGGPYTPHYERELTLENVANQLASFWGHGEIVQAAQDLEGSPEWELDRVVERCAAAMFRYYMQDESFDYDIILKHMDEYGWHVMLMPNLLTAKQELPYGKKQPILSFKQFPQHDGQYMTVYELQHSVYTKL